MAMMCGPNSWVLGYDKAGMIRGEFVIPVDGDVWGMCKFLDGKVKEKSKDAFLYSVRQMRYEFDVHYVKVVIKYVYKGYTKSVNMWARQALGASTVCCESGRPQSGSVNSVGTQQVAQRCGEIPVAPEPKKEH